MPDCFISYSTTDEPFARAVYRDLTTQSLDVFMAGISIQPGEKWSERIRGALHDSKWVIFLASKAACASPWVQQEIGSATDGTKTLVPVVWDMPPTELPAWANQHQALDIRGLTPPQIQARILEIARRIKSDKTTGLLIAGGLLGALFVLFSKSE
jgi:hypothetical protein